jgi:hypothetical protein
MTANYSNPYCSMRLPICRDGASADCMSLAGLALQTMLVASLGLVAVSLLNLRLLVFGINLPVSFDGLLGLLVKDLQSLNDVPNNCYKKVVSTKSHIADKVSVHSYGHCIANERSPFCRPPSTASSSGPWAPYCLQTGIQESVTGSSTRLHCRFLTCKRGRSSFLEIEGLKRCQTP